MSGVVAVRWPAATAVTAGIAIWLFTHRNFGLGNDGALYAVMALNRVHAGAFAGDLFLRYGSQDPFSIFSPFYAAFIRAVGLDGASLAMMLGAAALWLGGAWMLTRRFLRGTPALIGFLLLAAVPAAYGGWSVLQAGGNAPTPRPFAEALVMIGMALMMRRAWLGAAAALALAALFHPAMALAGIGAAFIMAALRRPALWWAAPIGVAAALALAGLGVEPFGRLFTIMDPPWLAAVKARNGFVLPGVWLPGDWARAAAEAAICLAGAAVSRGARRAALIAVTITAAAGLAVAVAGAGFIHDALIVQLQTWRLTWLLAVAALPAMVLVALRLRRRRPGLAASALLAAPLLMLTRPFQDRLWVWGPAVALSAAGLVLTVLIVRRRAPALSPTACRLIIEAAAILPLANIGTSLINIGQSALFRLAHGQWLVDPLYFLPLRLILLAAAVTLVLIARRRPATAVTVAAAIAATAAAAWDARTPWQKYVTSGAASPIAPPAGGAILWGEDAADAWFLLGRPAWVSTTQASGVLFSRATALEWRRRRDIVRPVLPLADWSTTTRPLTCAEAAAPVARAAIDDVCRRAAGLAGIILDRPVAGGGTVAFTTAVARDQACVSRGRPDVRYMRQFTYAPCEIRVGDVSP